MPGAAGIQCDTGRQAAIVGIALAEIGQLPPVVVVVLRDGAAAVAGTEGHLRGGGVVERLAQVGEAATGGGEGRRIVQRDVEIEGREAADIAAGRARHVAAAQVVAIADAGGEGDNAHLAPAEVTAGGDAVAEAAKAGGEGQRRIVGPTGRHQAGGQPHGLGRCLLAVVWRGVAKAVDGCHRHRKGITGGDEHRAVFIRGGRIGHTVAAAQDIAQHEAGRPHHEGLAGATDTGRQGRVARGVVLQGDVDVTHVLIIHRDRRLALGERNGLRCGGRLAAGDRYPIDTDRQGARERVVVGGPELERLRAFVGLDDAAHRVRRCLPVGGDV